MASAAAKTYGRQQTIRMRYWQYVTALGVTMTREVNGEEGYSALMAGIRWRVMARS